MDVEILSRIQFAFTIMFHYIYPPLSIGLGVTLVIMEAIWLKTGNVLYHNMGRFWTRIFALTFAIGVATGIVMEFEFGTNWATYSRFVGDIFGSALAAEGIFAFFLESGFLAILLFGWNKVGPRMHFFATCMVCLGAHFSAIWIVVANSWMQTPAGFHLERVINGQSERLPPDYILRTEDVHHVRAVVDNFWEMIFNPSSVDRIIHVVLGCWLAGAFLVLSISAFYILRKKHEVFAKTSFKVAFVFAAISIVLQMISGDATARGVVKNQPLKLAAMEGLFESTDKAPMALFGWVDEKNQKTISLEVPWLLSLLCYHDPHAVVRGLNDLPPDEFLQERHPDASPASYPELRKSYWPHVNIVFQAYHLMIAIGTALFLLILAGGFFWYKGWLFQTEWRPARYLLLAFVLSVLGPQIAGQAGWFAAETGRQPWIVYEILKTSEGLSKVVTAEQVLFSLILFFFIYLLLFAAFIYLLTRKIQAGPSPEDESEEMPENWRKHIRHLDASRTNE